MAHRFISSTPPQALKPSHLSKIVLKGGMRTQEKCRWDLYKALMEIQGVKTVQNRILSHSIMMKIKTARST
jgi:hypothetical protein